MNDYNVVEQRNNKLPTHFEKEPEKLTGVKLICKLLTNILLEIFKKIIDYKSSFAFQASAYVPTA